MTRPDDTIALNVRAVHVRLVDAEVIKALFMVAVMNVRIDRLVMVIAEVEAGLILSRLHDTATVAREPLLAPAVIECRSRGNVREQMKRVFNSRRRSGRRSRDGERLWDLRQVDAGAAGVAAPSSGTHTTAAAVEGVALVRDDDRTVGGGGVGWASVDGESVDWSGVDRSGVGGRSVGRDGVHVQRRGAGRGSGHRSNWGVEGEVVARSSIRKTGRMKVVMSAQGGVVGRGGGKYSRLACVVVAGDVTGNARAHDRVRKGCGD